MRNLENAITAHIEKNSIQESSSYRLDTQNDKTFDTTINCFSPIPHSTIPATASQTGYTYFKTSQL